DLPLEAAKRALTSAAWAASPGRSWVPHGDVRDELVVHLADGPHADLAEGRSGHEAVRRSRVDREVGAQPAQGLHDARDADRPLRAPRPPRPDGRPPAARPALVKECQEPPRRFGRRQARARDRRLHLGEQALDVVAREEVALQAIVDHGPEPGPLLLAPPALERAARAELAAVVLDDRPDLVHP